MTVRDTSIKTYHEIKEEGLISDREELVADFIKDNPDLTDTEIAIGMGYSDMNKTRPRRRGLVQLGIVEDNGKRKCSRTGRTAYIWKIKDKIRFTPKKDGELTNAEMNRVLELIERANGYQLVQILTKVEDVSRTDKKPSVQKTLVF